MTRRGEIPTLTWRDIAADRLLALAEEADRWATHYERESETVPSWRKYVTSYRAEAAAMRDGAARLSTGSAPRTETRREPYRDAATDFDDASEREANQLYAGHEARARERAIDAILQDVFDLDPSDYWDTPGTLVVSEHDLRVILERHLASAPRPQEGEAPALPVETRRRIEALVRSGAGHAADLRAMVSGEDDGWSGAAACMEAMTRELAELLARLASPLPPRDERRAEPGDDTALLDELAARVKQLDRLLVEHHAASVMREEHDVCPLCTVAMFAETGALLNRVRPRPARRAR
jgi:hypothetical protein